MLNNMFGPHVSNLERSLGRATQRQGLLALNLSNVNTPGYKRKDVDFGIILAEVDSGSSFTLARNRMSTSEVREYQGAVRVDGNSVNMEQEVASMAETEMRYQMLTEVTRRYFGGLNNVIRGSER